MKIAYLLLIVPVMILLFLTILSWGEKQMPTSSFFISPEIQSPGDWIKESQIKVYDDKIVEWRRA